MASLGFKKHDLDPGAVDQKKIDDVRSAGVLEVVELRDGEPKQVALETRGGKGRAVSGEVVAVKTLRSVAEKPRLFPPGRAQGVRQPFFRGHPIPGVMDQGLTKNPIVAQDRGDPRAEKRGRGGAEYRSGED